MSTTTEIPVVPRWGRFEASFASTLAYADPIRDVQLEVIFTSPAGQSRRIDAFWDGASLWRVRFAPDAEGEWSYVTVCSNAADSALHGRAGRLRCAPPAGETRFARHGPLRLSASRRHLEHADGTPFFWVADTAWNGPLRATASEWGHYLSVRARQGFSAVQWVATQWLASPEGDVDGRRAFAGVERIAIDAAFFQRLDARLDAATSAGLLNVPVLLWAAVWSTPEANGKNPGVFLPEDQAVLLARYLVARWAANPVVWILPGDGDYRGERAERWRRIGRAVFGDQPHAPVLLHPAGMQWYGDEFRDESWVDMLGYQSGHGDDQDTLGWLVAGPPAVDWKQVPARPIINLEPPYEDHVAYHSQTRISADFVRRALYWSLLVSPAAGVSYGAHGVWGWDDGSRLSEGHPVAGLPQSWRTALGFAGAEQVQHLVDLFASVAWWRLIPAPELLASQPGAADRGRFVAATQSPYGKLAVIYNPQEKRIELNLSGVAATHRTFWFNPRDGTRTAALPDGADGGGFTTPGSGDWVLVIEATEKTLP